ncbi:MAG TPA: ABC transporter ATP-binding protein, partial [Bacillota bacterium]
MASASARRLEERRHPMAAHPSAADLIRLDRITVRQNGKTLLKELSWRVRRGEHWAVLGRNGSGKTTLLNVINGYLWPTAGSGPVEVLGERFGACDLPELRRRIGWVSSALHEGLERWHRVRRVVLSGKFAALGWVREATAVDEQRAERLLEQLGCADLADRPYGSLSQGEQQRVLIARALMAEPQLLLLDEPCAGLDFVAREQVLRAIEAMIGDCSGPAVVLVTHHA